MNVHGYLLFPPLSASWGQGKPAGWWEQQGEKEKEGKQKEQEERRPRQEMGRVKKGRKREREGQTDRQRPPAGTTRGGHPRLLGWRCPRTSCGVATTCGPPFL